MKDPNKFGDRLKKAIKEAGLTQKELSEILRIHQETITNYVKGTIPRADILLKIAEILNVSPAWLLNGKERATEVTHRDPDFGARLAEALAARGITVEQAASALEVRQEKVEGILAGEIPNAKTLLKLARLAGVSMEWLLSGEGAGPPQTAKDPFLTAVDNFTKAMLELKKMFAALQAGGKPPPGTQDEAAALDQTIETQFYRILPGLSKEEREKLYRYLEYLLESRESQKISGSSGDSGEKIIHQSLLK